jgi:hypothetical protein
MMNERLKDLAEKAGFVLWGEETWNPGDVIDWSSRYDDELTKYAELIVRECIKLCEHESNDDEYDQFDMGQSVKVENIKASIMKEFRVE